MPGPKPKPKKDQYKERFKTEGQRVTRSGDEVIMSNGRRFKRTVLPSPLAPKPDEMIDLDEVETSMPEETEILDS